jgi:hypothetical protein
MTLTSIATAICSAISTTVITATVLALPALASTRTVIGVAPLSEAVAAQRCTTVAGWVNGYAVVGGSYLGGFECAVVSEKSIEHATFSRMHRYYTK